jgi:hypothetical protein
MSVSSALWAVSMLGSSSTQSSMLDLPNPNTLDLLLLAGMPPQGTPETLITKSAVADTVDDPMDGTTTAYLWPSVDFFQYSRYFSPESWLLSELSAAHAYLSLRSGPSEDWQGSQAFTPAELLPLDLAATIKPWAVFAQASEMPDPPLASSAAIRQQVLLSSVEDWVAISDVRVVPTSSDNSPTSVGNSLLLACTDLSSQTLTGEAQSQSLLTQYQIWFKDHHLGDVSTADGAEALAQKIRQMLLQETLDPASLYPVFTHPQPAVRLGETVLFTIDDSMASDLGHGPEWIAVAWTNRLRQALGAAPLDAGTVQMALEGFEESEMQLQGTASWYGPYFHGRLTATGETFDQNQLTVAHKTLPFGTYLKVRNLHNNRTVVVRVNDRGPYIGKRSLDLSKAAAQCLGSEQAGVIPYEAIILEKALSESTALALSPASQSAYRN